MLWVMRSGTQDTVRVLGVGNAFELAPMHEQEQK